MNQLIAIISLKVCPGCGAKAPLGEVINHDVDCDGDYVCNLTMGSWPIEEGDQVMIAEIDPISD